MAMLNVTVCMEARTHKLIFPFFCAHPHIFSNNPPPPFLVYFRESNRSWPRDWRDFLGANARRKARGVCDVRGLQRKADPPSCHAKRRGSLDGEQANFCWCEENYRSTFYTTHTKFLSIILGKCASWICTPLDKCQPLLIDADANHGMCTNLFS